jgi:hypothetical protein
MRPEDTQMAAGLPVPTAEDDAINALDATAPLLYLAAYEARKRGDREFEERLMNQLRVNDDAIKRLRRESN